MRRTFFFCAGLLTALFTAAIAGLFAQGNFSLMSPAPEFLSGTLTPGTCRGGDFYFNPDSGSYRWCYNNSLLSLLDAGTAASTYVTPATQSVRFEETLLSATQVKNLIGTPVQLVASPGNNYVLKPVHVGATYHGMGATAYTVTGAGNLVLLWGTTNFATSHSPTLANTILTQTSDEIGYFATSNVDGQFDTHDNTENQALMLSQDGMSEYATGNGTVQIEVFYVVVPVH